MLQLTKLLTGEAPGRPDWSSLPPELWCEILLSARGPLKLIRAHERRLHELYERWLEWWMLVARVSCTCTRLRDALLGPGAAELWRWAMFYDPGTGGSKQRTRGVHRLLSSQGRHAHRALVHANDEWQPSDLTPCVATLTSLQRLDLAYIDPALAACLASALSSTPSTVSCHGAHLFASLCTAALQRLTHLHLSYLVFASLSDAAVVKLSRRLPRLSSLELSVALSNPLHAREVSTALGRLHLLRTAELHLDLEIGFGVSAAPALLQLCQSGVQLQSLHLSEGRVGRITLDDEEVLAGLCGCERLVVASRSPVAGRRLQYSPQVAVVRNEPVDKRGQTIDAESDS